MRIGLLAALAVAALGLAGCETYSGPVADCFSFLAGEEACAFRPVPGTEQPGHDA